MSGKGEERSESQIAPGDSFGGFGPKRRFPSAERTRRVRAQRQTERVGTAA